MFQIIPSPLEEIDLKKDFLLKGAGAFSSFEGVVRDRNAGRSVIALEYETYEALCVKEAGNIFQEVRERFSIIDARCYHRSGKLLVGDMAVWVGVSAAHREDSFQACRYIIDEVKRRLPIWKNEYYENGDTGWVACEACHSQPVHDA